MLNYKGRLVHHSYLLPWEDLLEVFKAKGRNRVVGGGGTPPPVHSRTELVKSKLQTPQDRARETCVSNLSTLSSTKFTSKNCTSELNKISMFKFMTYVLGCIHGYPWTYMIHAFE